MGQAFVHAQAQPIGIRALRQAGVLRRVGNDVVDEGFADGVAVAVGPGGEHAHQHRHVDVVGLNLAQFHLRSLKSDSLQFIHILRYRLPSGFEGFGCAPDFDFAGSEERSVSSMVGRPRLACPLSGESDRFS